MWDDGGLEREAGVVLFCVSSSVSKVLLHSNPLSHDPTTLSLDPKFSVVYVETFESLPRRKSLQSFSRCVVVSRPRSVDLPDLNLGSRR